MKLLGDLARRDPECRYAVAELLREVVPWTAAVLVPPDWDRRYTECFGFTLEDIGIEGVTSLETKLRSAGLPLEELPGPPIFMPGLEPIERVRLGFALVQGGIIGDGPASSDPDTMAALFNVVARGLDLEQAPSEPGTIQWDFHDADPWHILVANGQTRAEQGRAGDPTVTLTCRYEDWAGIVAGRADPRLLTLRGRLRPRGDLRWLWRARAMFPQ